VKDALTGTHTADSAIKVAGAQSTSPSSANTPKASGRQRFILLDTLRGYAALVIMFYHFSAFTPHFAGYMAVDFFLILSGFVLTHAYFSNDKLNLWSFIQARFARLYPLHLVTLLAIVGLTMVMGQWFDKSDFLLHFFMIHNIGLGPDTIEFNSPSWSIAVEFWVNVVIATGLVTFAHKLTHRPLRWAILLGIAFVCFAVIAASKGHLNVVEQNILGYVNLGLLRGFASFCIGVVIYEVYARVAPTLTDQHKSLIALLTPPAILVFALSLFYPHKETAFDFLLVPLFSVVVFLAAFETGLGVNRLKRFAYLGAISFAVYLVHVPVQRFFEIVLNGAGGLATYVFLSTVVTLAIASLTHHLFELPMNKLVKKWLRWGGNLLKRRRA